MNELQWMALRQAIHDMTAAKAAYDKMDSWHKEPLSNEAKTQLSIEARRLFGSAKGWIEAVIGGDEGED